EVEASLLDSLAARETVAAQGKQRHAVERLEDDARRAEIGESWRNSHLHVRGERGIDELQSGATDGTAGDDHRAHLVRLGDRGDVLHGAEDGDPVHDVKTGP